MSSDMLAVAHVVGGAIGTAVVTYIDANPGFIAGLVSSIFLAVLTVLDGLKPKFLTSIPWLTMVLKGLAPKLGAWVEDRITQRLDKPPQS